jgi:hypothetical protein
LRAGRPFKLALAFTLVAIGSASTVGEGLLNAGVAAAREALDVMDQRSPGERTEASMTKGKPRIDVDRVARALPRIRDARASSQPPATAQSLVAAAAAAPDEAFAAPAAAGAPVAFAGAPGGVGGGGPGGVFFPPFGGGGGGGGGGGLVFVPPGEETPETPGTPPGTPGTPPTSTAPIPEPASWAMMIMGFAVAGVFARMRSRRRSEAHRG